MARVLKDFSRHLLHTLLLLTVFAGAVQILSYAALVRHWEFASIWQTAVYGATIVAVGGCSVALVSKDRRDDVHGARMLARALVALLLFAFAFDVLFVEDTPLSSDFIVQFVLVVSYQVSHDPNLDWHNPREGGFKGLIPLSFFCLLWIFVICSFVGLVGETIVSAIRDGRWESRAGFVFGPLSPIYGVGGVLITVALNRLHGRAMWIQFVIAGAVGATFEYLAGWFFENAFGIVAWSYQDQPFNFHGHTSLFMACIWGLCGLLWIRVALPAVMRLIDRIPLAARAPLTIAATVILLVDAVLTVVCLDCWYLRKSGVPIETSWQEFCNAFFDDSFMQSRFETMSMWPSLAGR